MTDSTKGNFLTQSNKDFPLDCETLDYLQNLAGLAMTAGSIAGDKVVLYGCAPYKEGTCREEGYVFLRTCECPQGEILRWEGGSTQAGMYVKLEDVGVNANNVEYPKAYTRRSLAPGIGGEHYSWDDFTDLKTVRELMDENKVLRDEIGNLKSSPLGIVEMWAGESVPEGYLLCNGDEYRKEEYPELAKALGDVFNNGVDASGKRYSTNTGYFRVPDLKGRFVVGIHDSDDDYRTKGAAGGLKKVTLTTDQLPSHSHKLKDYYYAESEKKTDGNRDNINVNGNIGGNGSDYDNDWLQYYEHSTESAGKGKAVENRPPYYVLAYIMRAK